MLLFLPSPPKHQHNFTLYNNSPTRGMRGAPGFCTPLFLSVATSKQGMGKSVSLPTVQEVLKLRKSRSSYSVISKQTGISKSTISRIVQRNSDPKHISLGQKRGPKSRLTTGSKRGLNHFLTTNRNATLPELSNFLSQKYGIILKKTQLGLWRKEGGWKSVGGFKKPALTNKHRVARIRWCEQYLLDSFDNVFFVEDEKTFTLDSQRRKFWKKEEEEDPPNHSGKYGRTVKVWAGMSRKGKTEIFLFQKKMNGPRYVECLEDNLFSVADNLYGTDWYVCIYLLHENDSPHVSKYTKEKFASYQVEIIPHPANSPDLNPIEKIWSTFGCSDFSQVSLDTWRTQELYSTIMAKS